MSDPVYYYSRDRQTREGPMALAELRALAQRGVVRREHLVWTEGMGEWAAAGTVAGLFDGGPPPVPSQALPVEEPVWEEPAYAGFWLRFLAWIIDTVILSVGGMVIGFFFGIVIGVFLVVTGGNTNPQGLSVFDIVGWTIGIVLGWLYYALMESSAQQATLGKMALRLRVTTEDQGRLSFGRASGRHFAKYLSGLTFLVGYIMAGFTERKQGLHDMIARCLVVREP